jgi:hypothetical protein
MDRSYGESRHREPAWFRGSDPLIANQRGFRESDPLIANQRGFRGSDPLIANLPVAQ